MSATAVIAVPARLASQRLPRKMLLAETGRPLVEHTWRNASQASQATAVVVVSLFLIGDVADGVGSIGGVCVASVLDLNLHAKLHCGLVRVVLFVVASVLENHVAVQLVWVISFVASATVLICPLNGEL